MRFRLETMKLFLSICLAMGFLTACNNESEDEVVLQDVFTPLPEGEVNFAEHVASIIQNNCVECHREGQSAPFSLTDFDDVRKRGKQIIEVVESEYMPPWLPDQPRGTFLNERILSAQDKGVLKQWHDEGMKQGDPAKTPPVPTFSDDWELGEPDLVLKLQEEYTIPAEGPDIYRNFVIPIEKMEDLQFVRTVDFKPMNPAVVHHMVLLADPTISSRELDKESEEPGFPGIMSLSQATMPSGHFHGWTPGKKPSMGTEGISWPLQTPLDLVLQVHLQPTGKEEKFDVEIGLYLTKEEPKFFFYPIVFRNKVIDLPAGSKNLHVKSQFRLPVDVQLLSIYPHAHYLGTELKAYAHLADNTTQTLLSIPSWDFDWQDEYSIPGDKLIVLPAGTMLEFDYTYDNSADNPNNPSSPPVKVEYGQNSTDEMAELLLMVITKDYQSLDTLSQYTSFNALNTEIKALSYRLKNNPDDLELQSRLAVHYIELGDPDAALAEFEKLMKKVPEVNDSNREIVAFATTTSAQLNMDKQNLEKADSLFAKASEYYEGQTNSLVQAQIEFYRGDIAYMQKDNEKAESHFRKAIESRSDFHEAWNSLAWMYAEKIANAKDTGDLAINAIERAIEITEGSYGPYLVSLARIHEMSKNWDGARKAYQKALDLAQKMEHEEQIQRIKELISNLDLVENGTIVPKVPKAQ